MKKESENTEVIYFRLPYSMKEKIKRVARESSMTLSKYLRGIVVEDIANTSITRAFIVVQQLEKEMFAIYKQLGYNTVDAIEASRALKLSNRYLRIYE